MVAQNIATELGYDFSQGIQPISFEVHPSNLCNIKCRTCKSFSSSKWNADSYIIGDKAVGHLESGWSLDKESAAVVKKLLFLGGEPMLHQEFIIDQLEMVKKYGDIKKLKIAFNMNVTVEISDRLVDAISNCKAVGFDVSLDGYGQLSEYIRSDSVWEQQLQSLNKIKHLVATDRRYSVSLFPVVSIMNINKIVDLFLWWRSFMPAGRNVGFAWCHGPRMYNAKNLPDTIKSKIVDVYDSYGNNTSSIKKAILNHLLEPRDGDADKQLENFMIINGALDKKRNLYFENANPEMYKMLLAYMAEIT